MGGRLLEEENLKKVRMDGSLFQLDLQEEEVVCIKWSEYENDLGKAKTGTKSHFLVWLIYLVIIYITSALHSSAYDL